MTQSLRPLSQGRADATSSRSVHQLAAIGERFARDDAANSRQHARASSCNASGICLTSARNEHHRDCAGNRASERDPATIAADHVRALIAEALAKQVAIAAAISRLRVLRR